MRASLRPLLLLVVPFALGAQSGPAERRPDKDKLTLGDYLDWEDVQDGERTARTGCVDTKKLLAERITTHYAPARERYAELMANPAEVDGILEAGADSLKPKAAATMAEVREKMGLR